MQKLWKKKLIVLFLLTIFIIPLLSILRNDSNISNIENRPLAGKPGFTREGLISGQYFSQWEEYASDHIIGRNRLIKGYTILNKSILSKNKINNIVIGQDKTLLPYYTEELSGNLDRYLVNLPVMADNLNNLKNQIHDYGGHFLFLGLPGQSSFFRDRYQGFFDNREDYFLENEISMFQLLTDREIDFLNMNDVFRQDSREDYYLKTDHHFSFEGAYKTYLEIINKVKDLNIEIRDGLSKEELNIVSLDQAILGSRNRQIYFLEETEEKLSIAFPREEVEYEKTVNGLPDNRLYYLPEDNSRPSYSVYMGGDQGEIVIKTHREDLPNILIFGDSFTNALEPLLYYHFNESRILDLRHFKSMDLTEYISLYKPDLVLMIRDDLNYGNLEGNGKF